MPAHGRYPFLTSGRNPSPVGFTWPMLGWWFLTAITGPINQCHGGGPAVPSIVNVVAWASDAPIDLSPGGHYQAGTRLRVPSRSLLLTVPVGWHATVFEDSDLPFLVSDIGRGMGMMFPVSHATEEDIEQQLTEPLALSHGIAFIPTGSLARSGSRIRRSYVGDATVGRALAVKGPFNQWMIYFLMGPDSEAVDYDAALDRLADSTVFQAAAESRGPLEGR